MKKIQIRSFVKQTIPRRETLKKKSKRKHNNKIKFINEYKPFLPNIYSIWRKINHLLKNNEELKNIFKNGIKDFQIVYRKGGKNIKEWLAKTNIRGRSRDFEKGWRSVSHLRW